MKSSGSNLIYLAAAAIVICFLTLVGSSGCTYVDAGYVGIVVNSYGSQRGVEDYPIKTGRVWLNPFTQTLHKFPVFMQTAKWDTETNGQDDRLTFNSSEGAGLKAGVSFSYTVKTEMAPHIFVKFRKDLPLIEDTYLRNEVRNAINTAASNLDAASIFGSGRAELINKALISLRAEIEDEGFVVDMLTFTGEIDAPPNIRASINKVIEAAQSTLAAEQKVKQVEAEARQKIAEAEGEAQSVLLKAKAEAEANELLTKSISGELMKYKTVEKWDGILPKFNGGGVIPFINVEDK